MNIIKSIIEYGIILILLVVNLIIGVLLSFMPSNYADYPSEFFSVYLKMDKPKSLNEFSGKINARFPAFLTAGYVEYEADDDYINALIAENDFTSVECSSIFELFENNSSIAFNTETNIACYTGEMNFYKHYIIHLNKSQKFMHYIQG